MRGDQVDIGLRLLDHQLIDSEDVRCGKVDDVLLELDGNELVVTTLLSGPAAQRRRLPQWARRATALIGRNVEHRVPWGQVRRIRSGVELNSGAEALGLGAGDRNARDLIPDWLPKSDSGES